ncbi:hypothetical protein GCM10023216_19210 [Isoptericola chiayiensis]|uniref:Alpha/beta hydrolase n=1 Tax=Isoptericola chiayiensis TaxID=579446 RepID=A0ABP8YGA7_9MICO|nr:hypothetical protein [Isoptericola chiayiensis]NOW00148.1 hypothetical protein [Isoptericola chiayiensis]
MTSSAAVSERPIVTFLPSPFLGPSLWDPVAERLRTHGWQTHVADTSGTSPAEVLDRCEASLPDDAPLVLVPHSNAGLYVPAIAAAGPPAATVFVDAALPPSSGEAPLTPPALRAELQGLAGPDGTLPPWPQWWPREQVRPLVPDDETFDRLVDEAPRMPVSYVGSSVEVPAGWERGRLAYLAFGDTYAAETSRAREAGWPTDTLPGGHLHPLVDPEGVAAALTGLLARV